MMAFLKKSSGAQSQQGSRWLRRGREPPAEVSCPAACRLRRTNAPPAESGLRARRNCLSLRSVEFSEPLPIDRLVGVPDHPAALQLSFAFRIAFGPVSAALCGPLFHSASSE